MNFKRIIKERYNQLIVQHTRFLGFLGAGSLPDFIIIGAQKGGTTSLYKYLLQHPQILGANRKELQFFTKYYGRGSAWYKACFPSENRRAAYSGKINKTVIAGEGSPYYIFHPGVPSRIADVVPHVKLIALLRHPVDRLISHYHHMVRIGREALPLREALDQEEERLSGQVEKILANPFYPNYQYASFSYRARGRYIEQLERYAAYFKREQFLILHSERFFASPQTEYDKVLKFLGVEAHTLLNTKTENKGSYKKENMEALRRELGEYFKPYNERLYEFVGEDYGW